MNILEPNLFYGFLGTLFFMAMLAYALRFAVVTIYEENGKLRFVPLLITMLWAVLLFIEPTPALSDFSRSRPHPPEAALRTLCMATLFIWAGFRSQFGRNPVEYIKNPILAPRKNGFTLAVVGFAGIALGIILLLRAGFLLQLIPAQPSWLFYSISGTALALAGLFFAITGIFVVESDRQRKN